MKETYNNIEMIIKEFDLNPKDCIDDWINELTRIQKELHPDKNPQKEFSNEEHEKFVHATDAKDFLREYKKTNTNANEELTIISEVSSAIALIKENDRKLAEEKEIENKLETAKQALLNCTFDFTQRTKNKYKKYKLSSAAIFALITILWNTPSSIKENPILELMLTTQNDLVYYLSFLWTLSLLFFCLTFIITSIKEQAQNQVFNEVSSPHAQEYLFSSFVKHNWDYDNFTFTKTHLIDFISNEVFALFNNRHGDHYINRDIYRFSKIRFKNVKLISKRNRHDFIREITPKITDLIIMNALDKNIIYKVDIPSWEDTYILNDNYEISKHHTVY